MHANALVYPEVIDLLAMFPKVHVGLGGLQMVYSREKFHRLLLEYVGCRADQPHHVRRRTDIPTTRRFAAYESAEFLSEQQLEGIFCKNAARFLRRREVCETAD